MKIKYNDGLSPIEFPHLKLNLKTTGEVRLMFAKLCGILYSRTKKRHPYPDIRGLSSSCLWFYSSVLFS
jgi:hypothetical protein